MVNQNIPTFYIYTRVCVCMRSRINYYIFIFILHTHFFFLFIEIYFISRFYIFACDVVYYMCVLSFPHISIHYIDFSKYF